MLFFESDYQDGAYPAIMERLYNTNSLKSEGYGMDSFCIDARNKIRAACKCPNAGVYFLVGGTQTNATVIDAFLKSYQGVIAAKTGHISVHEAGAIELGGHKVLTLPQVDGKITAETIRGCCQAYWNDSNRERIVMPAMVYLSQPTECGTLYSRAELSEISAVCKEYQMSLYVDGARLAYALACKENDVTLQDLSQLCDVFYIGGTKCGALFGEAVVIPNPSLIQHFCAVIKQHGALLAKGRLLGIQFDTLFTDELYHKIGKPAIEAADRIRTAFIRAGYRLAFGSPTNQVFVIIEKKEMEQLAKKIKFEVWEELDEKYFIIRLVTCWATTLEETDQIVSLMVK